MNKLIIGIPTRQRSNHLLKLLSKLPPNIPCVVSIDGIDKSYDTVKSKFPTITYLHTPFNSGIGYARKTIADFAVSKGYEYTFFMDDNNKIDLTYLSEALKLLDQNKDIKWLGVFNNLYKIFHAPYSTAPGDLYQFKYANNTYIIRNEIFKLVNYDINQSVIEDNDLNLKLKIIYYPKNPIYIYKKLIHSKKRHEEGGSKYRKTQEQRKQMIKYFNDKYGVEVVSYNEAKNDIRIGWERFNKVLNKLTEEEMKIVKKRVLTQRKPFIPTKTEVQETPKTKKEPDQVLNNLYNKFYKGKPSKGKKEIKKLEQAVKEKTEIQNSNKKETVSKSYARLFEENFNKKLTDTQLAEEMRKLHPNKKHYSEKDIESVRNMWNRNRTEKLQKF